MTVPAAPHTHLRSLGELDGLVGQQLGVSSWRTVEQDHIDTFARATGDDQWIHVDVERAKRESPFGGPIAHGYLTLSLIIPMWGEVLKIDSVTMAVNYGLNKVRFTNPVPAGGLVRLNASLKTVETLPKGGAQVVVDGIIELDGSDRPAVVAEAVYRFFE
jgi:acyl dehydratase